jgi:hypothetical protein
VVFSRSSGFSTNRTNDHDITEIVLKVALNTTTLTLTLRKPKQFDSVYVVFLNYFTFKILIKNHAENYDIKNEFPPSADRQKINTCVYQTKA